MGQVLAFIPELFGLTGTAASAATGALTVGAGLAGANALKSAITPPTPAPTPATKKTITSPEVGAAQQVQSEQAAAYEELKKRRGRSYTIATSGMGLLSAAPLTTKKLLGQ